MLVVDVSGSEAFGTRSQFKREILTEIAATLAFSALQNNDKVGLVLFSDQIELFIPPKKGRSRWPLPRCLPSASVCCLTRGEESTAGNSIGPLRIPTPRRQPLPRNRPRTGPVVRLEFLSAH